LKLVRLYYLKSITCVKFLFIADHISWFFKWD